MKKKLKMFPKMWQMKSESETVVKYLFEWMKMISNLKKHKEHLHILMSCKIKKIF